MESQIHQRLLFITISSLLVFNCQHSTFVQNVAAEIDFFPESASNLQPATSPSPEADSPEQDLSRNPTSLPQSGQVSFPPESYTPSDSPSPSESNSPNNEISPSFLVPPLEALPPSANVDTDIKKICDSTDYPSLCLATIVPFLNGSTNVLSVLEVAIKASNEYAKFALYMIKKLCITPGIPHQIVSILNDCRDSYEDVLYNFENALNALPDRDIGTMNSMLSAVMTDVGDCEDGFSGANFPCPVSIFADKLINMTSNCFAIVTLIHNYNPTSPHFLFV